MQRTVSALVTFEDTFVGVLDRFAPKSRWWSDVEEVAAHLGSVLGVPAVVLRLVDVVGGRGMRDGHVTYHAEALWQPAVRLPGEEPASLFDDAPRRASWATAAGVREALNWAEQALDRIGRPSTAPTRQIKTWNLSGLFRFSTKEGAAWLKTTPLWASCEATAIEVVAAADPSLVPQILAADRDRRWLLLDHTPGIDHWTASADLLRTTTTRWVKAQSAIADRWSTAPHGIAALSTFADLLDGEMTEDLTRPEIDALTRLVNDLPILVAELGICGIPNSVVHGDFHSGNWRSDGREAVIIDWADSMYSHPAIDAIRLRDFVPSGNRSLITAAWVQAWSTLIPDADPAGALRAAEPLAHLSRAVRYQAFLDNIEDSERRYHIGDPADAIRDALDCRR